MTADARWTISGRLEEEILQWLASFGTHQLRMDDPIYPSIMWSLGGEAYKGGDPEHRRTRLPPGYVAGFYRSDPFQGATA